MAAAAIFDLDRTLLAGASGPVISAALKRAGIFPDRSIPGENLMYGLFNTIGETLPAMAIARQAAGLAKGKIRSAAQAAAVEAADQLVLLVQPFVANVMAEHRAAGRTLVMATTTPYDFIKPLGDRLGFDHVIATRYGVDNNGAYDGTINGHFVWANGKLAAVSEWAERAGVSLAESFAYSDSFFDSPLLGAVGHPVAVNPDPSMRVMATLRRWPTLHFDVPPGVPKFLGLEPQQLALASTRLGLLFPYARFDIDDDDRVPSDGPGIIVGNHRSYFDTAAIATLIGRTGRTVRFLGKKEVFEAPIVGQLAKAFGGIPVNRGTGSDAPLRAAAEALEAGELVAMMPQGTIPRGAAFFEPKLVGRWGAARLAAMTRAPIIPVGLWGTEKVWPRNQRLPNVLNVLDPPTIRIRVGKPVKLGYSDLGADTEKIMTKISSLLPAEARKAKKPTAEEIARTLPPGFKGDPNAARQHRPGKD
jgi:putative phosphoserine phosphatase / 1-acylglycerol-3-phosphate O-acyltransferase